MLEFACPHCGRKLKAKPTAAGKVTPCPQCSELLRVPAPWQAVLEEREGSLPDRSAPPDRAIATQELDAAPRSESEDGWPPRTAVKAGDDATTSYPALEPEAPGLSSDWASDSGVDREAEEEALKLLAPAQGPDEIGRLGSYRVLKVLGTGGMGVVFQAEDTQLKRLVALKAILPSRAESRDARQRFLLEAQAAAAVKDERIVTIHQVGEDRGIPFLAMEFLEGESLEVRVRREGRLPVAEVLRIGREVAAGLAVAHQAGLIHRDIKPANIWLETKAEVGTKSETNSEVGSRKSERKGYAGSGTTPSEFRIPNSEFRIKILDFGLARVRSQENQLTRTGIIVGTPAFMSPEQARGKEVDARSDLFSLGCVLYCLCTGKGPFKGPDTLAILLALTQETPEPPRLLNLDVPYGLSELVMRLLAKDREERPPSAQAVVETIQGIERELATSSGIDTAPGDLRSVLSALGHEDPLPTPKPPGTSNPGLGQESGRERARQPIVIKNIENARIQIVRGDMVRGPAPEKPVAPSPAPQGESSSETFAVKSAVRRPGRKVPREKNARSPAEEDPVEQPAEEPRSRRSQNYVAAAILVPAVGFLLVALFISMNRKDRAPVAQGPAPPPPVAAPGQTDPEPPPRAAGLPVSGVPGTLSPFEDLQRNRIDPYELAVAGGGDPEHAPSGLVGILGDSRLNHWSKVTSVAFSPDGQSIASGCAGGTVTLWDALTGRQRCTLRGPAAGVNSVAFSPDGEVIAAGGRTGAVFLWETATGKERRGLAGQKAVTTLAFSPDGDVLALGSIDGTLKLWETITSKAESLPGHQGAVTTVAFSPDGRLLASGGVDKTANLWQAATGKHLRTLPGNRGPVACVAFARDGRRLAIGNGDGTIRLCKLPGGEPLALLPASPTTASIHSVAFGPDGKLLAAGDNAGAVVLWDSAAGTPVRTLTAHRGAVFSVAFSPDGKALASGGGDGSVNVWNPDSGKLRLVPEGHRGAALCVAVRADGTAIASGGDDGTVRLWQPSTGKPLHVLAGHQGPVAATAFSPDGKVLASASHDGTVKLWQPATGKDIAILRGHGAAMAAIAFSPDGHMLASCDVDGKARLWNGTTGKELRPPLEHRSAIHAVAFSPDGKVLACAGNDGLVRLWEPNEGRDLGELAGLVGDVMSVAFSPDAQLLAGGSRDGTVMVWEIQTGKERNVLIGHRGAVNSVVFSASGKELASAGADGTVRIWEPSGAGKGEVSQLGPAGAGVHQVALNRDARYLVTANANGTIYIFLRNPKADGAETR